ncbi:hypothetical protein QJQ45_006580 [Haematococcus lacustris]|nr:hypothetical protein QJQ45_006580 [Haematococcus lacustris]
MAKSLARLMSSRSRKGPRQVEGLVAVAARQGSRMLGGLGLAKAEEHEAPMAVLMVLGEAAFQCQDSSAATAAFQQVLDMAQDAMETGSGGQHSMCNALMRLCDLDEAANDMSGTTRAEQLMRQALRVAYCWQGTDHLLTAQVQHQLAQVLLHSVTPPEEDAAPRVLHTTQSSMSMHHRTTPRQSHTGFAASFQFRASLSTQGSLDCALYTDTMEMPDPDRERLKEAEGLLRACTATRTRLLGAEAADTLASQALGIHVLISAGRVDEAHSQLVATCTDCEAHLGILHPSTQLAEEAGHRLAKLYFRRGHHARQAGGARQAEKQLLLAQEVSGLMSSEEGRQHIDDALQAVRSMMLQQAGRRHVQQDQQQQPAAAAAAAAIASFSYGGDAAITEAAAWSGAEMTGAATAVMSVQLGSIAVAVAGAGEDASGSRAAGAAAAAAVAAAIPAASLAAAPGEAASDVSIADSQRSELNRYNAGFTAGQPLASLVSSVLLDSAKHVLRCGLGVRVGPKSSDPQEQELLHYAQIMELRARKHLGLMHFSFHTASATPRRPQLPHSVTPLPPGPMAAPSQGLGGSEQQERRQLEGTQGRQGEEGSCVDGPCQGGAQGQGQGEGGSQGVGVGAELEEELGDISDGEVEPLTLPTPLTPQHPGSLP